MPVPGVTSKDVLIDAVNSVAVRLYLPSIETAASAGSSKEKLPILVYFHSGRFVIESAFSPSYQRYVNSLVANACVVAVSVEHHLAPEHLLPAAYDDSRAAFDWAVSGADPWLSEHGDTGRVFLAGDSAGGNIAHNMAIAAPVHIEGALLLHASFSNEEKMAAESGECVKKRWMVIFPGARDRLDDPSMNPMATGEPGLKTLACKRMLVCAASVDPRLPRKRAYYEAVKASGWGGEVDWFESEGQGHVFFVHEHSNREAAALMDRVVTFFNAH